MTNSDSIMISRSAQRKCVKCLQNAPLKDSIIIEQQHRIKIKDSTIQIQIEAIQMGESTIDQLDGKLSNCKNENINLIQKKNNALKIGFSIGGFAGGIIGWLLNKNIN